MVTSDRELLDQLPLIAWIARGDGYCEWLNRCALAYYGVAFEAMTAMKWQAFVHPSDVEPSLAELAQAVREGRSCRSEIRLRRADGRFRWHIAISTSVMSDANTARWVGVALDTEDQRELERRLHEAHRLEAIGALAAGIAHRFNSQLAVVMTNTELAIESGVAPDVAESLAETLHATRRLAGLIQQLQQSSPPGVARHDVMVVDTAICDIVRFLQDAIGDRLELRLELDAERAEIACEKSCLRQILINLMNHIGESSGERGIVTLATARRRESVVIEVRDSTAGDDLSIDPRIFEPFFTTTSIHDGGLGLYAAHNLVRQLGGTIEIRAGLESGRLFAIALPQARSTLGARLVELNGHGEVVLLVDDVPELLTSLARSATRLGYVVLTASSGEEALAILAGQSVDLLVSDISMPRMTGIELAELVSEKHDMPIVLMTGYDESRRAPHEIGFSVLQKPFDVEDLARALRDALSREPPRSELDLRSERRLEGNPWNRT